MTSPGRAWRSVVADQDRGRLDDAEADSLARDGDRAVDRTPGAAVDAEVRRVRRVHARPHCTDAGVVVRDVEVGVRRAGARAAERLSVAEVPRELAGSDPQVHALA